MRRQRQQQQQQQLQEDDAPPPALAARPQTEIISDFEKYSKKDKATPESKFMTQIRPRLSFILFALYFGCLTEFSKLFLDEEAFAFQMLELNRLHSVNFPFQQEVTSVVSVFTHDFVKPCANPFLYEFTEDIPCNALVYFLRRFFKLSLLTDEFLHRLALICWAPSASLNPGFVVGMVKSLLGSAETNASEARFFCFKCVQLFKEEIYVGG